MSLREADILRGPDAQLFPVPEQFIGSEVEKDAKNVALIAVDYMMDSTLALLDLETARTPDRAKYERLKKAIRDGEIAIKVSTATAEQTPLLPYPTKFPPIEFGFLEDQQGEFGVKPAIIIHDRNIVPNLKAEFPEGFTVDSVDELTNEVQKPFLLHLMMAHTYISTMDFLTEKTTMTTEKILFKSDAFYGGLEEIYARHAKRLSWSTIPEGVLPEEVQGAANFSLNDFMREVNIYLEDHEANRVLDIFNQLSNTTYAHGLNRQNALESIRAFIALRAKNATKIVEKAREQRQQKGDNQNILGEEILVQLLA